MTVDRSHGAAIAKIFGTSGIAAQELAKVDWHKHPLGPPERWPAAFTIALANVLACPEPMYIVWGKELSFFFNDLYVPLVRPRWDGAMGSRFNELWADIWVHIEPGFAKALAGESSRVVDQHVSMLGWGEQVDHWWSYSFSPLYDEHGVIGGVQCVTNETTEYVLRAQAERRAAEALAVSEARLRRAQEAGQIGIFAIDIDSADMVATSEFYRLFGLPEVAAMKASVIQNMVIPEDAHIISDDRRRKAEEIDLQVEYRIRRADNGEIRWIERRGEFERDENGRPLRLVGVVQDVTERQMSRAALANLNATLEARVRERTAERNLLARIVEETDNFVFVVDTDFRWMAFNQAGARELERIFGKAPKVGERIHDALTNQHDQHAMIDSVWGRALDGEEFTMTAELGDRRLVPELRTYELKFNVLRDEAGKPIGSFQVVADITDRVRADAAYRQMQETLRQSQKMEAMGQLTGGVAHDFNNLLTPIIGSLDLIQRRSSLSERESRLIDSALQSAERAKVLVQRLLAFARRQPLQTRAIDMTRLVHGMAELVASTSGPQIKIHTEIAEALPPALADHNQLEMAILNLCVNARDAMPDGGTLTIAVSAETIASPGLDELAPGDYVRLSVIDSGTGMDDETLRRAIEPFYSTKGVGKGTGLGLSMVDGLASQLGGTMKIASRLGLGTRIDLWLPASGGQQTESADTEDDAATTQFKGRALVVDDEVAVRITTADMLQGLGYDTEEADNARDAERILKSGRRFDLVVTDHLMPGKSGAELAMSIRHHWPAMPVLIVSGYADAESIAPDMPRLAKPFREADLARAIGQLA
jgi:PAS domain S-box-containing protein